MGNELSKSRIRELEGIRDVVYKKMPETLPDIDRMKMEDIRDPIDMDQDDFELDFELRRIAHNTLVLDRLKLNLTFLLIEERKKYKKLYIQR